MLLGHKKLKMVLEIKFQDQTKPKQCDWLMQKSDRKALATIIKEKASILERVYCNMDIFQTPCM